MAEGGVALVRCGCGGIGGHSVKPRRVRIGRRGTSRTGAGPTAIGFSR
jgi:hypothetical protein